MKIEILKSCVGFNISFKRGDVCEVDDKIGRDLVNAKFAKEIKAAKAAAPTVKAKTAVTTKVATAKPTAAKTAKAPTPETAAAETAKTGTANAAAEVKAAAENGGEANADA